MSETERKGQTYTEARATVREKESDSLHILYKKKRTKKLYFSYIHIVQHIYICIRICYMYMCVRYSHMYM